MADTSHINMAYWQSIGRPGVGFEAWAAEERARLSPEPTQNNGGSKFRQGSATGTSTPFGTAGYVGSDDQFSKAMAGANPETQAAALKFRIDRQRAAPGMAPTQPLPTDIADIVTRDIGTGSVRRARTGSTRSAIMGPFSNPAPSQRTSLLGGL